MTATALSGAAARYHAAAAAIFATLILTAIPLCAQTTSGDIVGTVYDPSGAAIPGAKIEATNVGTGVKAATTGNTAGEYQIRNLLIGTYTLTATAANFQTTIQSNVVVQLNTTQTINLTLQVGNTATTVEISSAPPPIETTTSQLQATYSSQEILDLPQAAFYGPTAIAGIANLSLLNAGVTTQTGAGYGTGPSVGGQRPTNNSYNVEGIDNNDKGITGPVVQVPIDSIGQFSILLNNFNPEFGFTTGGVFNTNIKSGTNEIHGSIYEYLQNRDLNAVDQETARQGLLSNPRYDANKLGATIGGPILKNKLFYFADFEYNPIGQAPTPSSVIYAPTAAGYATIAGLPGISKNNLGVLQKYLGTAPATDGTTTPVGNATIPLGPLSVVGPSFQNQYNLVTSGDWNISDKDQFRLRYIYNKLDAIDTTANLPVFWGNDQNYVHLVSMAEFHNFSATATNEFRLSYSRRFNNFSAPDTPFPGLDQFPNLAFSDLNAQLGPNPSDPQGYIQNIGQLTDNFTKVLGAHTIKAGYEIHDIVASNTFIQRARGDYEYNFVSTYLFDLSPDIIGERSYGTSGGIPVGFLQNAAYVNDDYRFRPNLTFNLGLRYEYVTVPVASRYQSLNSGANLPGFLTFNEPKSQTTNFAPRVGFAYSPGSSATTSIRGGFSISYDQFYNNLAINEKPPFFQSTSDVPLNAQYPSFLADGGIQPNGSIPSGPAVPIPTGVAALRAATASYTTDQIRPYAINWTLGVQHVFAKDYTLEVRYVGTKGVHLWVQEQLNRFSDVTPTNSIPTFFSMPSAATLAGLTTTLGGLQNVNNNPYAAAGFTSTITSYQPVGNSSYNALDVQVKRNYTRNLSLIAAYTWSHAIDDSTDTVAATYLTPRRGQNFQDLSADKASSLLDHRQRLSLTETYDAPWFRSGNWFMKNLVGNWNLSATYVYESPESATIQSGVDSNLNGDSAGDRTVINTAGQATVGSGVTAYNAQGQVVAAGSANIVAYVANNQNARYVQAGLGAYANGGRNTFPLAPIDNIDAALTKRFNINERMRLTFGGQFYNLFNHSQFIPGFLSDVTAANFFGAGRNFLEPQQSSFGQFQQFFPSNSRQIQLVAKFIF
jgi:hypothetical protein